MTNSKIIPLFRQISVQVDVIDRDLNIIQTIYLLGKQPDSIKQVINKDGIASKKLKSRFKDLLSPQSIEGGIDWEDINDEDFETMINTEIDTSSEAEIQTNPIISPKKEVFNYDIEVYKEDTVATLQKKIAIATGTIPQKQHLSMNGRSLTHYIEFRSSLDTSIDDLDILDFLQTTKTTISGVPFDENYLFSKESSVIINTQSSSLNKFTNNEALHLTMISLDSIIANKETIQFLLRTDKQSFEMVYDSFVERFFTMMNIQTFLDYLNGQLEEFDIALSKRLISNQKKIIDKLNTYPQVHAKDKDLIINTSALTLYSKGTNDTMLSLTKLFNNIAISEVSGIFYLDLLITTNNRLKQIRKISKYASQALNFVENIAMNVKPLAARIKEYRRKDYLVITMLPSSHCSKLIVNIDAFGGIEIVAYSCRSTESTKSSFVSDISMYIQDLIKYLNTISEAFVNAYRLETNLQNYQIVKSTSKLMFNTQLDYDKVIKYFLHDLDESGLVRAEPVMAYHIKFRSFALYEDNVDSSKGIQVASNSRMATFILFDLATDELSFYIDMIGRFVAYRLSEIKLSLNETKGVHASDPVLYRYKSKFAYSRICQKKFQPVIADSNDPKAVKYHNFTFGGPQYYRCPNKAIPFLGLISGYHPEGYCLPCCRKNPQRDQEKLISKCISGDTMTNLKKKEAINNKYYLIDYPNDMVSNQKLVGRISNVPDTINKILTKGNKLLINGMSVDYAEHLIDMQIITIIQHYLHKESIREILLLILDYLKDYTNHEKVLLMPSVSYSFDTIDDLISDLNRVFMKQTIMTQDKNWNDILIDIFICLGINIVLLADNRLKSTDCANVINQQDDCSLDPGSTAGSSLKMEKLEYANLSNPVLLILKRIDTEYSRVNRNRRYSYFPIIFSDMIEPSIISAPPEIITQLTKIKNINEAPITNVMGKSFDHNTLLSLINKRIQIKALYNDSMHNVAYAFVSYKAIKTMLISLYRTPLISNKYETTKFKRANYTADIDTMIKLIEDHNMSQLETIDLRGFYEYLKINLSIFQHKNNFSLPTADKYILKIDKFIIHDKKVVGAKINAIDAKQIMHTIIIYIKPTTITKAIAVLQSYQTKINSYKKEALSIEHAKDIFSMGLDLVQRTQSILYNVPELQTSEFDKYFLEYLQDPISLIDVKPIPIDFASNNTLLRGQYMRDIYRLMINKFIEDWSQSQPTELINSIIKLVESTKPSLLVALGNNLIEDWVDKLIDEFGAIYHANIIRSEIFDLIEYIHLNVQHKTKSAIIKALQSSSLPINDIEMHNLAYANLYNIQTLVSQTAKNCLVETDSIPTKPYINKSGKLLILKSIYSDLVDLAASDLNNQFRREYILSNCLINSIDNRTKLKSQMDELIYIQEL